MAESKDWMSTTWGGKAAMFANIRDKIATHQAALGLTNAQVQAAQDLCDEFAAVFEYYTQANATAGALTEWRDLAMTGSPKGGVLPAPTAFPIWSGPGNEIINIIGTIRDMREQWVAASGYTQAIGEDLMIVAGAGLEIDPNTVTPTISVSPAQSGYLMGITISNRGESDMWIVETRKKGGQWTNAGSFTGKTADITITPTTPGDPEQIEVRVRLRKNNQDYGNISQTATVTVNP